MVEVLCGILADGPVARELLPMYVHLEKRRHISHSVLAIDIGRFVEPKRFRARLQSLMNEVRALPSLAGGSSPMAPGDPEKKMFAVRTHSGIPIPAESFDQFLKVDPGFAETLKT
jgi:LDH2 family malate/lactate/ureidoglycolate dehydrogenase